MIIFPYIILKTVLEKKDMFWKFKSYIKLLNKTVINSLRTSFLYKCKNNDIIPSFLKFRIPNNGCFNQKSVHDFQLKLLKQEIVKAKEGGGPKPLLQLWEAFPGGALPRPHH